MVHFVGAGPGAPDLITQRGAALLQGADCIIYAGSLVNPALLGLAKPGCASGSMMRPSTCRAKRAAACGCMRRRCPTGGTRRPARCWRGSIRR